MTHLRFIIPIALIAVVAAVPMLVHAQNGPGGDPSGGMGRGHHGAGELRMMHRLLRMGAALELTDAQEDQILAILDAAKPEIENLTEALRQNRETWKATHEPTDFDETEARSFAEQQGTLQAELMVLTMKTRAQVLSILTPEQLEELETLRESRSERRGGRQGKGRAGK